MSTLPTAIESMSDLQAAILKLENRQQAEGEDLRDWFRETYETMRPANLIKSALTEVTASQDVREHLVSTGVGLAAGHATKAVYQSVSDSPMKGVVGAALQFGVTNVVMRHPELVFALGKGVFGLVRSALRAARSNNDEDEAEAEETDERYRSTAHNDI